MTFKRITVVIGAALFAILVLTISGCAGTAARTGERPDEAALPAETMTEQVRGITRPYDLESLLQSVLQLSFLQESGDYFNQLAWDEEDIFSDYMFKIFWLESGPYEEGKGTVLSSRTPEGGPDTRIERALVEILSDGSRWWRVEQEMGYAGLSYEVLISAEGIPQAIRYAHPETGDLHEHVPMVALEFERTRETMSVEEIQRAIQRDFDSELDMYRRFLFNDPQVLGQEMVEVQAGTFTAVHVQDSLVGEINIQADYWLSPDLPGGIIKIVFSNPDGAEEWVTELSELTAGNRRRMGGQEIVRKSGYGPDQDYVSEGSPDQPVEVYLREPYYGSVGPERTSYYSVTADRQSDIFIEVSDLAGDAELYYYGQDGTYQDWITASQGSTLDVQDYLVTGGTTLYFSIIDYRDEYGEGEGYTINVYQQFILDSTGIMIRGDIYTEAQELVSGRSYRESLTPEGLNYYTVTMSAGSTLTVQVDGLSQYAALSWFDVQEGSYSGAYSSSDETAQRLEVSGLSPGMVCYFYISGDTTLIRPGVLFEITVREQ